MTWPDRAAAGAGGASSPGLRAMMTPEGWQRHYFGWRRPLHPNGEVQRTAWAAADEPPPLIGLGLASHLLHERAPHSTHAIAPVCAFLVDDDAMAFMATVCRLFGV